MSEINWKYKIDTETLHDSVETWNSMKTNKIIDDSLRFKKSRYLEISVSAFLKLKVKNAGMHRIKNVLKEMSKGNTNIKSLAKSAFPINDRPRGETDIKSVIWHSTANGLISPIVVVRIRVKNNDKYYMLDGVHRLIGVVIRGSNLRIYMINAIR